QYATQTYAHVAGEWEQQPLVVLVDENSASAAEVLAGALQDHDRALLVGRRTFGKGLVQQPIQLQDGGELRLTVARYYTPAGRCIQKPYGPDRATYQQLASSGALRAYALLFYQQHKTELAGLRFAQYQAVFRVTDTELDGLAQLAVRAGLHPAPAALRACAPALRTSLKAYIAHCAYGPDAARAVRRDADLELQQALHVVQDSTAQLALLGSGK
ncbi:MAG: peptidase S41, partial [Hymenobacter sp.]